LQDGYRVEGPLLPIPLKGHKMVRLGKGQAILGGSYIEKYQAKIYSMTCSNRNCIISLLDRELSVPRANFVAIPIPDTISLCITGGKNYFMKKKNQNQNQNHKLYTTKHLFYPSNIDCQFRTLIGDGFCQDYNNNRHCAVDHVSIENSAQNANAKLATLTKSQMQE
jgi:hypothetical protein